MDVELLYVTPPSLVIEAIRTCWKSQEKSDTPPNSFEVGENDQSLVKKIISKGHTSTLEHSLITFGIQNMSRACLQEVSRHRVGVSPSVESTRYTFKRLIKSMDEADEDEIDDFLIQTSDEDLNKLNKDHILKLKKLSQEKDLPNDILKYGLVESWPVTEVLSFNIRSLRHFINLRGSKQALTEIRNLADEFRTLLYEFHLEFTELFFGDL